MGGSSAGEKDVEGDKVRTVRESSFILGGQAGGVYSTAYREAIPETAKLTGTGNSQVLVLRPASFTLWLPQCLFMSSPTRMTIAIEYLLFYHYYYSKPFSPWECEDN